MSEDETRGITDPHDTRDTDFRPRALAEMALAIRNDSSGDSGSADMAELIALGGGLEAFDAVIASLKGGEPLDTRPGMEVQQMAHVMAALTEELEDRKVAEELKKQAQEIIADKVPELAT